MSDRSNIEELIVRYLQQDINEEELSSLEAWLEESMENKSYFFSLKSISDSNWYPFYSQDSMKEAGWRKMKGRINREGIASDNRPAVRSLLFSYLKYAAIILLAIGTGWGINELQGSLERTSHAGDKIVYNELRVEKGGRANTLILSDGSKVVLNAATRLRYPTDFNGKNRKIYLDGEAYFEVVKDMEKPFIVKLKKQEITVLGTTFNVKAHSGEEQSIITLLSGRISLEAFNEKGESMSRMFLKPNQKAYADNESGSVSIRNTDASLANSWVKGEYKFKEEPLSSIAGQLENYYGVTIHLNGEKLKNMKYTGTFSLGQDIKEVLHIIGYEKLFTVKYVEKEIFITSK